MTRGLDPTGPAGPRAAGVDPEFGTAFVTVARDDTATVVLRAMPTTQIAGRVVADPDDGTLPMAAIRVGVAPADLDHAPAATSARATPRDDGRFVLPGLIGPHRFELVQAPPGWYLKSALIDGLDAADYPVTFGAVSQHGEALIVVGRAAEIGGRATDDRGAPAAGGSVVVFSTDPGQWYDRSRHLALTRPAADGTFRVEGLPAGEYWVAAVEGIPASEWQHPDVLRALVSGARRVRLADAQRGTADLRLMRLPGL